MVRELQERRKAKTNELLTLTFLFDGHSVFVVIGEGSWSGSTAKADGGHGRTAVNGRSICAGRGRVCHASRRCWGRRRAVGSAGRRLTR